MIGASQLGHATGDDQLLSTLDVRAPSSGGGTCPPACGWACNSWGCACSSGGGITVGVLDLLVLICHEALRFESLSLSLRP